MLRLICVTLIVLGWLAIITVLLGLVEQSLGLRRRMNRAGGA